GWNHHRINLPKSALTGDAHISVIEGKNARWCRGLHPKLIFQRRPARAVVAREDRERVRSRCRAWHCHNICMLPRPSVPTVLSIRRKIQCRKLVPSQPYRSITAYLFQTNRYSQSPRRHRESINPRLSRFQLIGYDHVASSWNYRPKVRTRSRKNALQNIITR